MPGREAEDMSERVDFSLQNGGGFAGAVLLIMFSEQAFLNAGPLIARGLRAPPRPASSSTC